jgi:hypothetical protein
VSVVLQAWTTHRGSAKIELGVSDVHIEPQRFETLRLEQSVGEFRYRFEIEVFQYATNLKFEVVVTRTDTGQIVANPILETTPGEPAIFKVGGRGAQALDISILATPR